MIKDGDTGLLVEPENPAALADRIIVLLKDKSLREQIGQRTRKFIEGNFSSEKMVERTIEVYKKSIDKI